jgi:branched-chain amino acid aminotransferase
VFEGVGIIEGTIVLLDEHVDRLYASAKRTGIEIDVSKDEMRDRIIDTARENEMAEGYLRPLVSRGHGPLGIHNTDQIDGPTIVIIPQLDRAPRFDSLEPGAVRLSSVAQSTPDALDPRVKSNNYMPNILAVQEIANTDAETAILLDTDGNVTEAAAANVFVVDDGELLTTPERSILVGTTRNAVLDVAAQEGVDATVKTLTPYDLYTADEMFLTGSLGGISPVVRVTDTPVGDGEIGPVTERLSSALRDHLLETGTSIE